MEREIKFRAWSKTNKKLIDLQKITPLALNASMNTQMALQGSGGLFIPFHNDIVVEQFTGLKDCKGKDIYEGDIVEPKYNHISPFEVKFEEGKFNISGYAYKNCEVIGNIHSGEANVEDIHGR